jgi:lipid-binding SYLF domain-containing protein
MKTSPFLLIIATAFLALTPSLRADSLDSMVRKSTRILETKQGSANPIPRSALKAALGVVVLDIAKGGFVFGGMHGVGVVVIKGKNGFQGLFGVSSWSAPIPLTVSGGSFGAQIGGTRTRTIILLHTEHAVRVFTNPGKLTWNASATGTAGNDSRSEQANDRLREEDVSIYKETEGLFGGATLGGSSLNIDNDIINSAYGNQIYVRDILNGKVQAPDYARQLMSLLNGSR